MSRVEQWSLHVSTFLVALSGLAYWVMDRLLVTDDPFALVNHPWQPHMLAAHVLAAPVLVLVFGIVFQSHIRPKVWRRDMPNRRSGMLALCTFGIMMLSGYALQVTTAPVLHALAYWTHLGSSSVFLVSYGVHQVISVRLHVAARRRACNLAVA